MMELNSANPELVKLARANLKGLAAALRTEKMSNFRDKCFMQCYLEKNVPEPIVINTSHLPTISEEDCVFK
jgi:hypothetical protein